MKDFEKHINYIPSKNKILHLGAYSQINDERLLDEIFTSCYTGGDVRASWIGAGIPLTQNNKKKTAQLGYEAWANWALQHWAMYSGFLDLVADTSQCFNILDIGCGTGHASVCLGEIFKDSKIDAVDLDRDCIAFAKEYNKKDNIIYTECGFEDFKKDDTLYDYIFALEVYEHLRVDLHEIFMSKCLGILKPRGLMFFTTPNAKDEQDGIGSHGHIGLLNKSRFDIFFKNYQQYIADANFYDNSKLTTCDPLEFIINEPLGSFMDMARNKSHFRIVFKK